MHNKFIVAQKNMVLVLLVLLCDALCMKKYMACLFCRKILRFSSSAFICLYLLFLLERKICIKHGHDNFCTVLIYYVEHRKNTKSIV
jgi:hypothetical protein